MVKGKGNCDFVPHFVLTFLAEGGSLSEISLTSSTFLLSDFSFWVDRLKETGKQFFNN